MKISQEQKDRNRQSLLAAAVEVVSQEGYKSATMQKIARRAKLSDAVIYKYFPTKESLLFGYFAWKLEQAFEGLQAHPEFERYTFAEQIQALFDQQLELYTSDKSFVEVAFAATHSSVLSGALTDLAPLRKEYVEFVERLLRAAIEAGEFPEPPHTRFIAELLWDFHIGVVYYWLRDETPQAIQTTQLLDKSLSLFTAVLKSDILSRISDLALFFAREHLFRRLNETEDVPLASRPVKTSPFEKAKSGKRKNDR